MMSPQAHASLMVNHGVLVSLQPSVYLAWHRIPICDHLSLVAFAISFGSFSSYLCIVYSGTKLVLHVAIVQSFQRAALSLGHQAVDSHCSMFCNKNDRSWICCQLCKIDWMDTVSKISPLFHFDLFFLDTLTLTHSIDIYNHSRTIITHEIYDVFILFFFRNTKYEFMFTIELVVSSVLVFFKKRILGEREITEKQTSSFTDSGKKPMRWFLIISHCKNSVNFILLFWITQRSVKKLCKYWSSLKVEIW